MFFFLSHDRKFILKTMTPSDLKGLLENLGSLYIHMD